MDEKSFRAYVKTLKPLKGDIEPKEFVKKLKKIYILDFNNVFFILKNRKYYKSDSYFLNMLLYMFPIPKKMIEKIG